MLQSIKQLYGTRLCASDGEIGRVKDFYFNDEQWVVRYVVADTGTWLPGRSVLLSPHAFGPLSHEGDSLAVNLTRRQIEDGPMIAEHRPVSRQYEEEYYDYYGWPSYWLGGEMWGIGGLPVAPPPHLRPSKDELAANRSGNGDDPHLRSSRAVTGYFLQAADGPIGHLADFILDDQSWTICHLIVTTGHWLSKKEIMLPSNDVERISYEESKVFVKVTRETIAKAAEYHRPGSARHDAT